MISESDAKQRREILREFLARFSEFVTTGADFSRTEIFGPDENKNDPTAHWTRGIMKRLWTEGYVERFGPTRLARYHALAALEESEDTITDLLGTTTAGEAPLATRLKREVEAGNVPETAPDEPELPELEQQPETPAFGGGEEPTTDEMVRALIGVLPQMVESLHRNERRVMAIEIMVRRIHKDLTGEG